MSVRGGTTPEGVRWLRYEFPLRPGFVVMVELPRDMTSKEAERVAAWLLTLAIPAREETRDDG